MVCAFRSFVLTAMLFASSGLIAQTVYKSVDEKGNVTYSESPPAKTKGSNARSTTEMKIDPNQNVFPAQKPAGVSDQQRLQSQSSDSGRSRAAEVAAAKAELEAAEAQLKAGTEVQAGDFLGRASGGVGPSQQRLQRLSELQRAVDSAKENLEKVEGQSSD
jgi:hypothetical protein